MKVGPKSSLRPFLHRALQMLESSQNDLPIIIFENFKKCLEMLRKLRKPSENF